MTRTVRDLATGADLEFSPLGPSRLRGVPGRVGAVRRLEPLARQPRGTDALEDRAEVGQDAFLLEDEQDADDQAERARDDADRDVDPLARAGSQRRLSR